MDAIKGAGWTRFKPIKGQPIAEKDMKKVFRLVDMDKSGAISQLVCSSNFFLLFNVFNIFQELKLAVKYLGKRYGINDVGQQFCDI